MDTIRLFQKSYLENITLSITEKCPVNCAHCITDSKPENRHLNIVHWSELLKEWHHLTSLKTVNVTGGEPFYASSELEEISFFCQREKLQLIVISNAYWAHSRKHALAVLSKYRGISHLSLSTDTYHQVSIPINHIINAYQAAKKIGISCNIKITGETADSIRHSELYKPLLSLVHPEKEILFQTLSTVGRASTMNRAKEISVVKKVCLSSSPLVRSNGRVIPCCHEIIALKQPNTLDMGNVTTSSEKMVISNIQNKWFFYYLRLWGIQGLYEALTEESLLKNTLQALSETDVCQVCYTLCSNKELEAEIDTLFTSFRLRLKIALGMKSIFNDTHLLMKLRYPKSTNTGTVPEI